MKKVTHIIECGLLCLLVAVGCGVSAWAEWSLFVSFAPEPEHLTAPITLALGALGALFVIAQFVFAGEAKRLWQNGAHGLAAVVAVACCLLLAVSVFGTASWFDTALVNKHNSAEQQAAQQQQQIVGGLLASANNEEQRGNHWRAGELRREAKQLASQTPQQQTTGVQAEALDRWLGEYRAAGLWLLAILADLIPLLAVLVLRHEQNNATEQTEPNETGEQNSATEHNKTNETDEQNSVPEQQTTPATESSETANRPACVDAMAWVQGYIEQQQKVPPVREAKAAGIGYDRLNRCLEQLTSDGQIEPKPAGRGYQLKGSGGNKATINSTFKYQSRATNRDVQLESLE